MSASPILRAATRLLAALILVFSVFQLLRGHDQPGGGFIGGLIASTAFALMALSDGAAAARRALRIEPRTLATCGLALALGSGAVSLAAGRPLLTGLWWTLAVGDRAYKLSTVLLFDLGVYLAVMGAVLAIVLALEDEP